MTLIVGIPACTREIKGHLQHATPVRYADALDSVLGAMPVMIPPMGEAALSVLDRIDGLLIPGSPSNVEPSRYGATEDLTPGCHDPARDATTLPLIRAAVARGIPVLAICRGIQELNVAFGGSLHQQVHLVAGRQDHRGGEGPREEQYAPKHLVRLTGRLAEIIGAPEAMVNSVHEQAVDRLGDALIVEATAADGTIEAVRVERATAFAFGVQWHPEWRVGESPASVALFTAFGQACRAYAGGLRKAA